MPSHGFLLISNLKEFKAALRRIFDLLRPYLQDEPMTIHQPKTPLRGCHTLEEMFRVSALHNVAERLSRRKTASAPRPPLRIFLITTSHIVSSSL